VRDAPHTLSIIDDDLDHLRALVSDMGGRVEASIHDSVDALAQGDVERALAVVAADRRVDALAAEVERHALQMIALRMPVADDLRDVLGALKISMLVARMGDCAKNIAHRAPQVAGCRTSDQVRLIQALEQEVSAMVKASLDAFVRRSPAEAVLVRDSDEAADLHYSWILRDLTALMRDRPEQIDAATHLLFVAQKLERIGDHASSIAEMVHLAVTGQEMPPQQVGGTAYGHMG
jgi:phosphate transport system protein